jgi:transposase
VGALTGSLFVDLLRGMLRGMLQGHWKLLHLNVEGLSAHKALAVKEYAAELNGKLTVYYLPGYAPDLNPDEFGLEPCQANQ